jgi:hypothetical protein
VEKMSKAYVSSAELKLENEVFDAFRTDMNVVIRELLKNMIARGSEDGKITATIEVGLFPEYTETGTSLQPRFIHKVSSVLQLKDEKKGIALCKDMELVLDEKTNTYYLQHIKGKPQMSIYDMEQCGEE